MKTKMAMMALMGGAMLLSACATTGNAKTASHEPLFSQDRIKADMAFLSDDLMEGRRTGTRGYALAAYYVKTQFELIGLKPAAADGTYFQQVPFRSAMIDDEASSLTLTMNGKAEKLAFGTDFLMAGEVKLPSMTATGDVVFAGYGVYSPEAGWDDLAGLDLNGKIVVVVSGAPKGLNSEIRAHLGSGRSKWKNLQARGATGVIFIRTPQEEQRRTFDKLKSAFMEKSFDWVGSAEDAKTAVVSALVSSDVATRMFADSGIDIAAVLKAADEGVDDMPTGALNAHVDLVRMSKLLDPVSSPNVLALIEGSDPKLKNEVVVLSGHLDHEGMKEGAEGEDHIYNGALDNSAGIATMLEVARAYMSNGIRPRRSILFAAVVAEEEGLLGSEYLAHFPPPVGELVANVNLDMPVLLYDFADLIAFGADRSTLGPITAAALAKADITLSPDPMPDEGIFTRSDHYRFVQKGVPAVMLATGFGLTADGVKGADVFVDFLKNTYHTPKDQMDLPIRFDTAAKFARVNWLILNEIANRDEKPEWNEGDFFGQTFAGTK
ncbi:M28 family metallopeptidase [Gimibacter soli]|uniref:M28 family metallopeptidase n=1 Tax=Gimibacter soli TaxID=3024400 RepID=A0AAF0BGL7_9PROT|nr:M28 family metallopeptidase [Gimibacter soli]WCL53638.1 M28 family metallopeptidase [Gimibacter soli]